MNVMWLFAGIIIGYLVATQALLADQDEEGDKENEDE